MKTDLYIIAAGKGSRMGGNIPKALVPINDQPCLTTTLQQVGHKFKNVFVVTNELLSIEWASYFKSLDQNYKSLCRNVTNIPISSGLGDGHAVMRALETAEKLEGTSHDVVILWGDAFIEHAELVDELLSMNIRQYSGIIPAVREANPYVSLLVDSDMSCISADFSKYGESHPTGFHDQSIFRFNRGELLKSLRVLHTCFWKGGRYITQGGELSMLYVFHYLYNTCDAAVVYETSYPTKSFNTPEEVALIQQEISKKWKIQNQS